MSNTFTAKALGDYLAVEEPLIRALSKRTLIKMDTEALTEYDINAILRVNPGLLHVGGYTEFVNWYYLEYCVNKAEAKAERYNLIKDINWSSSLQVAYRNF
jgi:hypothetical protein